MLTLNQLDRHIVSQYEEDLYVWIVYRYFCRNFVINSMMNKEKLSRNKLTSTKDFIAAKKELRLTPGDHIDLSTHIKG